MDWISTKEKLPSPGERVIACFDGYVCEAFYSKKTERFEIHGKTFCSIFPQYWMKMPDVPDGFKPDYSICNTFGLI